MGKHTQCSKITSLSHHFQSVAIFRAPVWQGPRASEDPRGDLQERRGGWAFSHQGSAGEGGRSASGAGVEFDRGDGKI